MSHDHILVSATMKTMNGENTQEAVVTVTFVILSGHFDIVNIYFSAFTHSKQIPWFLLIVFGKIPIAMF